jgi:hypothetical protein
MSPQRIAKIYIVDATGRWINGSVGGTIGYLVIEDTGGKGT